MHGPETGIIPLHDEIPYEANCVVLGGRELNEGSDEKGQKCPQQCSFDTEHLPSSSAVTEYMASLVALEVFGYFKMGVRPR